MRRLIPSAGSNAADLTVDITVDDAYPAPLGANETRPWVGLCMVTSIDGSTVVDGKSTELSSANDSAVLHRLRAIADVIIVGAGTVRGEGYGPPNKAGQRVGVVTRSGSVDTTTPLFTCGAGFIITVEQAEVDNPDGVDIIRAGDDDVDLRAALSMFGTIHETPRFVQAEGGAKLNAALLDADLLDEINVTTSPLTVGGDGPRLTDGAGDHAHRYDLAQLVIDDQHFVYCRWRRNRS